MSELPVRSPATSSHLGLKRSIIFVLIVFVGAPLTAYSVWMIRERHISAEIAHIQPKPKKYNQSLDRMLRQSVRQQDRNAYRWSMANTFSEEVNRVDVAEDQMFYYMGNPNWFKRENGKEVFIYAIDQPGWCSELYVTASLRGGERMLSDGTLSNPHPTPCSQPASFETYDSVMPVKQ